MLPILPALLLLLLSGSTKMDRAVAACLPGGLEALHRSSAVDAGDPAQAERLWASLLALKVGPAEMGRALAALMAIDVAESAPEAIPVESPEAGEGRWTEPERPKRPDGWSRSCRTRDGPAAR